MLLIGKENCSGRLVYGAKSEEEYLGGNVPHHLQWFNANNVRDVITRIALL